MLENCNDCPLVLRVDKLENEQHEINVRINSMGDLVGRTEERVKTIFNMLNDIKDLVKELTRDVSDIKNEPAKAFRKLQFEILKYVVIAALSYFATKYFG